MAAISTPVLAHAARAVGRMDHDERVRLADEIFLHQPNLLASVLVLHRMGCNMPQVEVVLTLLLVAFQAMKGSGHAWPEISEQVQEQCLQRLTGRVRFLEGLDAGLQSQAIELQVSEHTEKYLLAYVLGELRENNLAGVKSEPEKYLMLAALNLVDCIAATAAIRPRPS